MFYENKQESTLVCRLWFPGLVTFLILCSLSSSNCWVCKFPSPWRTWDVYELKVSWWIQLSASFLRCYLHLFSQVSQDESAQCSLLWMCRGHSIGRVGPWGLIYGYQRWNWYLWNCLLNKRKKDLNKKKKNGRFLPHAAIKLLSLHLPWKSEFGLHCDVFMTYTATGALRSRTGWNHVLLHMVKYHIQQFQTIMDNNFLLWDVEAGAKMDSDPVEGHRFLSFYLRKLKLDIMNLCHRWCPKWM